MKKEAIIGGVISIFFMVILLIFVPDVITFVFMALMYTIYVWGYVRGIIRMSRYNEALRYGRRSIKRARNVQSESTWVVLRGEDCVFGDDDLDDEFKSYCQRMDQLGEKARMVLPIEEYINADFFAVNTKQNLLSQIPGTMTSLGILGTFIGMILGISGMGFSSMNLALESIEALLEGIELAFYTSIVGVILAVIFNLTYHVVNERNASELQLFLRDYHRYILPSKNDAMLEHQIELMENISFKMDELIAKPGIAVIAEAAEEAAEEEIPEEVPAEEAIEEIAEEIAEEVAEELPAVQEQEENDDDDDSDDDDDDSDDDDDEFSEPGIRYRKAFTARLSLSSEIVNGYYSEIKNAFLSFKGVKSRISWNYETFRKGRVLLGMMFVRGKTLCVCLAHNVADYEDSKYHFKDVSEIAKYSEVPMRLKVKSPRGMKYVIDLIGELMEKNEIPFGVLSEEDFRFESKTFDKLMEENLIKMVITKGVKIENNENESVLNEEASDEKSEIEPIV